MFKDIDLGENKNLFVVSAILIAGIGGLAIKIPYHINGNGQVDKVITITSIATALLLGIVTYAIINAVEKRSGKDGENDTEDKSLLTEAVPEENTAVSVDSPVIVEEEAPEATTEE